MLGPGVSSWMAHQIGDTTRIGVSGRPSRMVSRKPCTAGVKARSRIRSVLTRLIPSLRLIRSAGVSRMVRAVNGSSRALPPSPRLTRSTSPAAAARAGQVVLGLAAFEPWLIELPWCSHTRRPRSGRDRTGASVRRAISSVTSSYGSQISTSFSRSGRPVNATVPDGPGCWHFDPVARSMVSTLPPVTLACWVSSPSTSRS